MCLLCINLTIHIVMQAICIIIIEALKLIFFATVILLTATYDVQTAEANVSGNNKIGIKVEFIENTTAKGYFIVFQNIISGPPDVFRAMPRSEATTTLDDIPPGTYTPVFYDLEQNGLPNKSPAYEPTNTVTVTIDGTGEGS